MFEKRKFSFNEGMPEELSYKSIMLSQKIGSFSLHSILNSMFINLTDPDGANFELLVLYKDVDSIIKD